LSDRRKIRKEEEKGAYFETPEAPCAPEALSYSSSL
jgi:hypothetical protein